MVLPPLLVSCLLLALPAASSEGARDARGMPEVDIHCEGADLFGGTEQERGAWCQARESRFASVRTLCEAALEHNPDSWRAHTLLGLAHHLGEGNLPKSMFHQQEAERLFLESHPRPPENLSSAWFVHRITLFELISLHGEMNLHQEQIDYVDTLKRRLNLDYNALKAWPLIKLRRFDEARWVAKEASELKGEAFTEQREDGLTALCAVESELKHRQAAYEACNAAAAHHLPEGFDGAVSLVNAAVSASEILKFDVAERLLLNATTRQVEGTINPWGNLTHLYLRQGRYPEALGALREMQGYRRQRPPHLDQQDQADADLVGATVLLLGGRTEDALRITDRTVHRPERLGSSSASSEQHEAGNQVMDRVARLEMARRLEEEASWSPWKEGWVLRVRAWRLRAEAWLDQRQAVRLMGSNNMLVTSVRPDCPGSIELPFWLRGALVDVLGPGVVLTALQEARAEESLPREQAAPYFDALEAEARWRQGDPAGALDAAQRTLGALSNADALVKARAAAVGSQAAMELWQQENALEMAEVALRHDPGVFRRMGARVPVNTASDGTPAGDLALRMVEDSPLFLVVPWGLALELTSEEITLRLPDGSALRSVEVPAGDDTLVEAQARRMVKAAHQELMAARVDVTQADIRSLDGGMGTGEAARRHADSLLDDILKGRSGR